MILEALLLVMSIPQVDDASKSASVSTVVAERSNSSKEVAETNVKDASAAASLPSAPEPKVKTDAEAIEPNPSAQPQPFLAVKPALTGSVETPRQRKMWYGLMTAGHAGAAFDAWSTRRAINAGAGQESNPFLAPFAHSNALYAATQVSPAVMDFLGKRMMRSQYPLFRKFWWLPQTAGASFSFAAGAHNVGMVH